MVNFNHFTYTTEKPRHRDSFPFLIRHLLRRNAASQLASCPDDWDLLLPVYTGDINKTVELDHTSAIFVQIKNRRRPAKLSLGSEYHNWIRPNQMGFSIQMPIGAGWQSPLTSMRQHSFTLSSDGSVSVSEPFAFGVQVFGDDDRIFRFFDKYPSLAELCGALVRTLPTAYETPVRKALHGTATVDLEEVASSGLFGRLDTRASADVKGGMAEDDTVAGRMNDGDVEDLGCNDWDDADIEIGDDWPMSGIDYGIGEPCSTAGSTT